MSTPVAATAVDVWLLDPALRMTVTTDRALLLESGPTIHRVANRAAVDIAETIFATSGSEVAIPASLPAPDRDMACELMNVLTSMGLAIRQTPAMEDPAPLGLFFETRRRASRPMAFDVFQDLLRRAAVSVVGSGALADAIRRELAGIGIQLPAAEADGQEGCSEDLTIYVADGDKAKEVGAFNRARIDDGRKSPWLLVQPFDGSRSFVGPLIVPETSACAECYRLRRLSNFPDDDISQELEGASILAAGQVTHAVSLSHSFVVGMVSQIVLDFIVSGFDGPTSTPGFVRVLTNTATELSVKSHRVVRVPRCPECSHSRGTGSPQIWFPMSLATESS